MNKYMMLFAIAILLSCSKNEQPLDDSNTNAVNKSVTSEKEEGLSLIERSDCMSCHQTDVKTVGPSYVQIAEKYSEKDRDYLATKIISGGKGVWGEVPMTPHSALSENDARKMVSYILKLSH